MTVRVLAFARVRELLGFGERALELPVGATAKDAWDAVSLDVAPLRDLSGSTRLACNGAIVDEGTVLAEGDEVALLPPVSGG